MIDLDDLSPSAQFNILFNKNSGDDSYSSCYSDPDEDGIEVDQSFLDFFDNTVNNNIDNDFLELLKSAKIRKIGEEFGAERFKILIQKISILDCNSIPYCRILCAILRLTDDNLLLTLLPPYELSNLCCLPFFHCLFRLFRYLIESSADYFHFLITNNDFLNNLHENIINYQENSKYYYRLLRSAIKKYIDSPNIEIIYQELMRNLFFHLDNEDDKSAVATLQSICYCIKYSDQKRKEHFLSVFPEQTFEQLIQDERYSPDLLQTYYYCISEKSECETFVTQKQFFMLVDVDPSDSDTYSEIIQIFIQIANASLEYRSFLYNVGIHCKLFTFIENDPSFKIKEMALELLAKISQVTNIDIHIDLVNCGILSAYKQMLLSINNNVLNEVLYSVNAILLSAQEYNNQGLFENVQTALLDQFEELEQKFVRQNRDYHDGIYGFAHSLLVLLRDDFDPE